MSKRKGELNPAAIDRGWPHQVILGADSYSRQWPAMDEFCRELSRCPRGHSVVVDGVWHQIVCFAEREHAQRFRGAFGGEWFDPELRGRGSRWHLVRKSS